jgi:hypothetical protein
MDRVDNCRSCEFLRCCRQEVIDSGRRTAFVAFNGPRYAVDTALADVDGK